MSFAKYGILRHAFNNLRDVMAENLSDSIYGFHFLHTAYSPNTCSRIFLYTQKDYLPFDRKIVFTYCASKDPFSKWKVLPFPAGPRRNIIATQNHKP
jgi:hypothetical protein